MSRTQKLRGALEAIERILNRGGDADDVLRDVLAVLHDRASYSWTGILFVEEGGLVLGPEAGERTEGETRVPIAYGGNRVGELAVAAGVPDDEERAFLERVAVLISAHVLLGWDTGGVRWSDVS